MGNQKKTLNENSVRVIKIGKSALFEFLYEKLVDGQDVFLDVDPLDVVNTFDINFERGEFIFCAYRSEDAKGKAIEFPQGINLQQFMATIPDTTSTMYADGRYKDYTKEELATLSKK